MANVFSISLTDKEFNALNKAAKEQGVSRTAYVADAVHVKLTNLDLPAYYATEKLTRKTRQPNTADSRITSVYLPKHIHAIVQQGSKEADVTFNAFIGYCVQFAMQTPEQALAFIKHEKEAPTVSLNLKTIDVRQLLKFANKQYREYCSATVVKRIGESVFENLSSLQTVEEMVAVLSAQYADILHPNVVKEIERLILNAFFGAEVVKEALEVLSVANNPQFPSSWFAPNVDNGIDISDPEDE